MSFVTRVLAGLVAFAISACTPEAMAPPVDGVGVAAAGTEALGRLGEDVDINVERDPDWCEGEEWTLWVDNSTLGVANWADDPLDEGDSDSLGGLFDLWEGDIIFLNGGCADDDGTWLVEDGGGFTVNIDSLEIDDLEYEISTDEDDEDAAPEEGTCVKRPHHYDLVCRIGEVDEDEDEYCLDDDGDGFGNPDECDDYEPGEEPDDYVDNSDDCDDSDPDINPDEDERDNGYDDDCDGDVDDDDSDCRDCDGDGEVEVVVIKADSWCEGEEWQPWFVHNDVYEDEGIYDLEVNDLDDDNEISGDVELEDGEYYRLQAWCDHDGDGNVWDANTWLVENVGGVVEHLDRLEIDGRVYSISTAVDATPELGACTRPSSSEYHLICRIDL